MKKRDDMISRVFMVTAFVLMIIALISCGPTYKIIPGEISRYSGKNVELVVTPTEKITNRMQFEFFIFIPVWIGNTMLLTPIPIFEHHSVYSTMEGIYVAKENGELPLHKIDIRGEVLEYNGIYMVDVQDYR